MRLVLILAGALLSGPALAQDAVHGTWRTQPDDNGSFGHVRMYSCGASICGQLIGAFGADGTPIESEEVGKRIVWDMRPEGGGAYGGGKIYSPDRGRTYASKMTHEGQTLRVSGCVLGICRAQTWTRVRP